VDKEKKKETKDHVKEGYRREGSPKWLLLSDELD
jgi:hypothetical protein